MGCLYSRHDVLTYENEVIYGGTELANKTSAGRLRLPDASGTKSWLLSFNCDMPATSSKWGKPIGANLRAVNAGFDTFYSECYIRQGHC